MKIKTFYDRDLGWFNSTKPDLGDLAGAYLAAAVRQRTHERISRMAGLSSEGAILPPEPGFEIDRSPRSWWKNSAL